MSAKLLPFASICNHECIICRLHAYVHVQSVHVHIHVALLAVFMAAIFSL